MTNSALREADRYSREIRGCEVSNPVALSPEALAMIDSIFPGNINLDKKARKRALARAIESVMDVVAREFNAKKDADSIDYEAAIRLATR